MCSRSSRIKYISELLDYYVGNIKGSRQKEIPFIDQVLFPALIRDRWLMDDHPDFNAQVKSKLVEFRRTCPNLSAKWEELFALKE